MRLENKTILITGGNSGIGLATAEKVIQEGGTTILVARDEKKLAAACNTLGKRAHYFLCDVSNVNQLNQLFKKIAQEFPIIHGVVANAGNIILEPIETITENSFDTAINHNLKSAFFTAQKGAPLMHNGGSIVMNASLSAHRTFENGSLYAATKAALISFASSMALEYAKYKIRVNSVSPGIISTPFFDKLGLSEEAIRQYMLHYRKKIALERIGSAAEIANVIAFLLSDESSYITGTDILADGGLANCIK